MPVALPIPSLGDKLQTLASLSPADVQAIETLVDFRLAERRREELERIRLAARPWPPARP